MGRLTRKIALLAALFGASIFGGWSCQFPDAKEDKPLLERAAEISTQPSDSFVVQKGDKGYETLCEAFKAEVEASTTDANREKVVFELNGTIAKAYFEINQTTRFQAGDQALFEKAYGLAEIAQNIAGDDARHAVEDYNKLVEEICKDKKVTAGEKDQLVAYLDAAVNAMNETKDLASKRVLKGLVGKINEQLDFYASKGKMEWYVGTMLEDGKNIGLSREGKKQRVDQTDAQIKALLGDKLYDSIVKKAEERRLSAFTPYEQGGKNWDYIPFEVFEKVVETDKVGTDLTLPGQRLSKDRLVALTDGRTAGLNQELVTGLQMMQVVLAQPESVDIDDAYKAKAMYGK